jgi:hypothetical protein
MPSSFHNADKRAHREVMLVGLLICAAFVAISFFAKEQPDNNSSKRTNWFVPRARRCLLIEFFGALGANGRLL